MKKKLGWALMIVSLITTGGVATLRSMEGKECTWQIISLLWILVAMRWQHQAEECEEADNTKKTFYNGKKGS
jgi:hypothetical protein